jgi:hypothetical protein
MVFDSNVIMDTSGHFRRRQLYIQRLAFSHFVSYTRLLYLEVCLPLILSRLYSHPRFVLNEIYKVPN